MSTYVLVHGGGHGGWCYRWLAPLLRAQGHEVHAPTLTGVSDRAHDRFPGINLDTHIQDIANLIVFEDLTDVILVGHSYGGMVITGVADRIGDRIGHLVYLDAATPRDGQSLADVSPALMAFASSSLEEVDGVELALHPLPEMGRLFGIEDPELLAWFQERVTPHPWACFTQKLALSDEAAVRRIPRTDLRCINTLRLAEDPNVVRPEDVGANLLNVHYLETGHDLMITAPDEVAELLLRLA